MIDYSINRFSFFAFVFLFITQAILATSNFLTILL